MLLNTQFAAAVSNKSESCATGIKSVMVFHTLNGPDVGVGHDGAVEGSCAEGVPEGDDDGPGEPVMEPEREREGLELELRAEREHVGVGACERVAVGLLPARVAVLEGDAEPASSRQYSVKPSLDPSSSGATGCTVTNTCPTGPATLAGRQTASAKRPASVHPRLSAGALAGGPLKPPHTSSSASRGHEADSAIAGTHVPPIPGDGHTRT